MYYFFVKSEILPGRFNWKNGDGFVTDFCIRVTWKSIYVTNYKHVPSNISRVAIKIYIKIYTIIFRLEATNFSKQTLVKKTRQFARHPARGRSMFCCLCGKRMFLLFIVIRKKKFLFSYDYELSVIHVYSSRKVHVLSNHMRWFPSLQNEINFIVLSLIKLFIIASLLAIETNINKITNTNHKRWQFPQSISNTKR